MPKEIKAKIVSEKSIEEDLIKTFVESSKLKKYYEKIQSDCKKELMPFVLGIGEYEIRLISGKVSIKITERKDLICSSDFDKALNVFTILGSFQGLVKDVSFKIDKKILESLNEEQKTALKEYIQEKTISVWTAGEENDGPE